MGGSWALEKAEDTRRVLRGPGRGREDDELPDLLMDRLLGLGVLRRME